MKFLFDLESFRLVIWLGLNCSWRIIASCFCILPPILYTLLWVDGLILLESGSGFGIGRVAVDFGTFLWGKGWDICSDRCQTKINVTLLRVKRISLCCYKFSSSEDASGFGFVLFLWSSLWSTSNSKKFWSGVFFREGNIWSLTVHLMLDLDNAVHW